MFRRWPIVLALSFLPVGCLQEDEEHRLLDRRRDLEAQRAAIWALTVQEANGRDPATLPQPEKDRIAAKYGPALVAVDAQLNDVNAQLDTIWRRGITPGP